MIPDENNEGSVRLATANGVVHYLGSEMVKLYVRYWLARPMSWSSRRPCVAAGIS